MNFHTHLFHIPEGSKDLLSFIFSKETLFFFTYPSTYPQCLTPKLTQCLEITKIPSEKVTRDLLSVVLLQNGKKTSTKQLVECCSERRMCEFVLVKHVGVFLCGEKAAY